MHRTTVVNSARHCLDHMLMGGSRTARGRHGVVRENWRGTDDASYISELFYMIVDDRRIILSPSVQSSLMPLPDRRRLGSRRGRGHDRDDDVGPHFRDVASGQYLPRAHCTHRAAVLHALMMGRRHSCGPRRTRTTARSARLTARSQARSAWKWAGSVRTTLH